MEAVVSAEWQPVAKVEVMKAVLGQAAVQMPCREGMAAAVVVELPLSTTARAQMADSAVAAAVVEFMEAVLG